MGFSDTMAGLGRGLLAGLESVAEQVIPSFVQAGAEFLVQKAFPGATASLPAGQFFGQRTRAQVQPPVQIPRQLPAGGGTLQQQIDRAAREGTAGPFRTPESGALLPDPFRDPGILEQFASNLFKTGSPFPIVPPTLPQIFPTTFPDLGTFPTRTLPGGTTTMPGFPSAKTEVGAGVLQIPSTAGFAGGCPSLFSAGGMSARPISMFMVPNPVTGKPTFFKHAGRPILFSGDLRACKTVNRIAARARRVRGGRR